MKSNSNSSNSNNINSNSNSNSSNDYFLILRRLQGSGWKSRVVDTSLMTNKWVCLLSQSVAQFVQIEMLRFDAAAKLLH